MEIEYYKKYVHTPVDVRIIILREQLKFLEGIATKSRIVPTLVDWDNAVIVVRKAGEAVGFLVFTIGESTLTCNIYFAGVSEDHRRQGIHTRMWNWLVEHCRKEGVLTIDSSVLQSNHAARAAFKAQGRREGSINYSYQVPPLPPKTEG